MTSEEQQVHNGRGRHKIGGNGRHLQRATSCSEWTKPPSNQDCQSRIKTSAGGAAFPRSSQFSIMVSTQAFFFLPLSAYSSELLL
ncbi:hypothetical protein PoB_005118100 [Plakobranchus ocellatus]|uniref:Uncharacterized protein n=1 Tax=Plakobranchus ocellatus TaxID=259542 RepID=A0AAV4BZY0_9GAST|nr:hypothetical protein PoB_005118100 [Plakobranchus ocellatus]